MEMLTVSSDFFYQYGWCFSSTVTFYDKDFCIKISQLYLFQTMVMEEEYQMFISSSSNTEHPNTEVAAAAMEVDMEGTKYTL